MKMVLLLTGRTKPDFVESGMHEYLKRIGKYAKMDVRVIPDIRATAKSSKRQITEREGEAILKGLNKRDIIVLLDERGKEMSSMELAAFIEQRQIDGGGTLVFVIGGDKGFSEEVYKRRNFMISLSRMTFSHQIVRVIFLEQLYRAFTIINNEPYHLGH